MRNRRFFEVVIGLILIFFLIWLVSITDFIFMPLFKLVGAVAFPIIGAGILYYLTKPLMRFFERFRIHRIVAILMVFIIILLLAFLFVIYIWPIVRDQTTNLVKGIPAMVKVVEDFISYWEANYTSIPDQVLQAIDDFTDNIPARMEDIINYLFTFVGGLIGQVISIIAGIVLIPFFLFFMLKDGEKLLPFITKFFKPKKAANLRSLLLKINQVLTAFIQGQLLVSFCVGVLLLIGYSIIRLDYALALALFGMVTNVIPYLGPFLAVTPALIVGAFQDPLNIFWVSIIMIVAQQIESNLISPNVMGQVLHMHPLTIITVILAAGSIAGFLGILFAVPFYAVVRTIIIHFYETYVDSKRNREDALF
ncbi:AI-2E family transporter [Oceanobacillus alkalisoli]|uniref:AI-2E family transporter n=1 Tax=Oceanobacillus alkalisoli TaxID=2925113 RepID=UPI001EE3F20B|nr:AI-2E family transporter [Oceanobacillus alkalisoli]